MKDQLGEKLLSLTKTFISLDELTSMVLHESYEELYFAIAKAMGEGVLKPIHKKHTNGLIPPLSLKYRILKEKEDMIPYIEEIRHLHPDLNISAYLANPAKYKSHRSVLLPLSAVLKERPESLSREMSKNERAYDIWNDEKILGGPAASVVKFLGFEELLNYYTTPEPFFDFILERKEEMTMLIVENMDTWYTLRRFLTKNPKRRTLHGKYLDGVVYGEGNKVTRPGAMEEYESDVIEAQVNFLYFGDLDFKGIDIYQRTCSKNPSSHIQLFTDLYLDMLSYIDIGKLGKIRKKQDANIDLEGFLSSFPEGAKGDIRKILSERKYIPQEAMNYPRVDELFHLSDL